MLRMLAEGCNFWIAVNGSFPLTVLISEGEDRGFLLPRLNFVPCASALPAPPDQWAGPVLTLLYRSIFKSFKS